MQERLIEILKTEKRLKNKGSLYSSTQIDLAYNSNRIEGSRLTEEQTRYIYETSSISTMPGETANVNDITETVNHFRCFDVMLDTAEEPLSEELIKNYHYYLKRNSGDEFTGYVTPGEYKTHPNTVGGIVTTAPEEVSKSIRALVDRYSVVGDVTINHVIDFHYEFERIHPFQDGNGRVGRMIMFKECLMHDVTPFIIEDRYKEFYYRGLASYEEEKGFLVDTCLHAQDEYKKMIDYYYPEFFSEQDVNIK